MPAVDFHATAPRIGYITDADNIASQRVILNNGGYLADRFRKPAAYGGAESLRYRIPLNGPAVPDAGVWPAPVRRII